MIKNFKAVNILFVLYWNDILLNADFKKYCSNIFILYIYRHKAVSKLSVKRLSAHFLVTNSFVTEFVQFRVHSTHYRLEIVLLNINT